MPNPMPVDVRALSPIFGSGNAISGCVLQLTDKMQSSKLRVECWLPGYRRELHRPFLRTPLPHHVTRVVYKLGLERWLLRKLERDFRRACAVPTVGWIWPGISVETFTWLKEHGHTIVLERVNSNQEHARAVLDAAYRELGLTPSHTITDEAIAAERRKLELADFVLCPSPMVRDTFARAGVPEHKLLDTSYGFDPATTARPVRARGARKPATFLFVGSGDVRKGLPWLLRSWRSARLDARLMVTGRLAPDVAQLCHEDLALDGVVHVPFTENLVPIYDGADVFVLPSLEEGSPLVVYMALAAGLPCLLGPAAASGLVRHDVEGLVVDPRDSQAFVAALQRLARDHDLRARLGAAAAQRAAEFTWDEVAKRRRLQLEELFAAPRSGAGQPVPAR